MAKQTISVGTAPNDGTGDSWRDSMIKANENFDELYTGNNAKVIPISAEGDFTNQDAANIYLDAGTVYQPIESFSTDKTIVFQGGRIVGLGKVLGLTMTYTGTGNQFSATNNNMSIEAVTISAPSGTHFSFTAAGGNSIALRSITSSSTPNQGSLLGFSSCNVDRYTISAALSTTGFEFSGSNGVLFIQTSNIIAAPSGFISFDLGTATFINATISQMFQDTTTFGNNAASVAVAGAANSANLNANELATVNGCSFTGLTSAFTNISPSDIRWEFMDSPPFENSSKETDAYLTTTATVTITVAGTFVAINGANWLSDIEQRFSTDNAGIATYNGERDAKFFVTMTLTVDKVGGGADQLEGRISLNGVTTGGSFEKSGAVTENSTATTITSQRLVTLSEGDTIQGYVANNNSTSNIEVSKANMTIIEI